MSSTAEDLYAEPELTMRSIIQRIATGPELSKDITLEEARAGMRFILDGSVDPVQAAIFLIALRMKRETHDENKGVLDAIRDATQFAVAEVDEVVDIADPYDGYNRSLPPAPFLPAVLASLGIPAVTHGLQSVGPKYGVTHRMVLHHAGVKVDISPQGAAKCLADEDIGWAYVDQSAFCPKLHDLVGMRTLIVKRPVITTVEVLAGPVRGQNKTHFVTGYVHKPYPPVYAMLARHAGFDSALLVRGVEGGVIASLRQAGKFFYYHDRGELNEIDINPQDLGIQQEVRTVPLPEDLPKASRAGDEIAVTVDVEATAKASAEAGLEALQGKPGPTRDALVYAAAMILWHLQRADTPGVAADAVREVLDSGKALTHFRAL